MIIIDGLKEFRAAAERAEAEAAIMHGKLIIKHTRPHLILFF
ncbi:hypothetical protein [Bacillus infantis]|nr:hypothetical protein [Bacillus infantis]